MCTLSRLSTDPRPDGRSGHWADSCRKPYRSKCDRLAAESSKAPGAGSGASLYFENVSGFSDFSGMGMAAFKVL